MPLWYIFRERYSTFTKISYIFLQTKCEQYWPDEGSTSYGNVSVEIIQTTVYTDFTIRTFKISCVSGIIKQLQIKKKPAGSDGSLCKAVNLD